MERSWAEHLEELRRRRRDAMAQGGAEAVARLHARGKLSARERLERLVDPGSFHELGLLAAGVVETPGRGRQTIAADGVVTGWAEIDGRKAFVVADDGGALGGAAGLVNIDKRFRLRRMAVEHGYPFVGLYEGSAIRFQDSMDAAVMSRVPAFREVVECAGAVPQVAALMGACFGRPPIDALLAELVVMPRATGFVGWSGPALVEGGLGERVELEQLAGAAVHAETTGLVDVVGESEEECLATIRTFLGFMPSSAAELPPRAPSADDPGRACPEVLDVVPPNPRRPYDMRRVVAALIDGGRFFEYKAGFGRAILTGLARLDGRAVGIVASQPAHQGGVIDVDASLKARRFVAVCDAFHIPLVFLQDQPGFMVGVAAEAARAIYWCGGFLAAVERATVPKVTVILRKAHGAAVWAMGGRSGDSPDVLLAWPAAVMTGTGPASAVNTIHARELTAAEDPRALRRTLEAGSAARGSVYRAAAAFGVDDVIEPPDTRRHLIAALDMATGKLRRGVGRKRPLFP